MNQNQSSTPIVSIGIFSSKEEMRSLIFHGNVENIKSYIDKVIDTANYHIDSILAGKRSAKKKKGGFSQFYRNFVNPNAEEIELVDICLEKAAEGIETLSLPINARYPNLQHILYNFNQRLSTLKNESIPQLKEYSRKKKGKNRLIVWGIIVLHVIIYGGIFLML